MAKQEPTTPRTREWLQRQGYLVATVEQWQRWPKPGTSPCRECGEQQMTAIRSDLFGVFDLIGFHPTEADIVVVQTTTLSNHSARKVKVLACMEAKLVLMAGVRVLVQSWGQDNEGHWRHREEWITLADYKQAPHYPSDAYTLLTLRKEQSRAKRKERAPALPPGTTLPFNPIRDEEVPF